MLTTLGYRYPAGQEPPVIAGIRKYLDGWPGVGRIIAGMARQQYDLQLRQFGQDGWSVTFYPAGIAHSLTLRWWGRAGRESRGRRCSGRRGRRCDGGRRQRD